MLNAYDVFEKFFKSVIAGNNHLGKEISLGRAFYTWRSISKGGDLSRADQTRFQFLDIVLDFLFISDLRRVYLGPLYGKEEIAADEQSRVEEFCQRDLEEYENSLLPDIHKLFMEENSSWFPPGAHTKIFVKIMEQKDDEGSNDDNDLIRYAILRKDLSVIHTNLIDIPSDFTEYQGVKVLLKEFETIAFEILSLIYSSLFDDKLTINIFDERRYVMLQNISLFTEKYFSMVTGCDVRKEVIARLRERNDGRERLLARSYCTTIGLGLRESDGPTWVDHILYCILEYAVDLGPLRDMNLDANPLHDIAGKVKILMPLSRDKIKKYEKYLLEEVSQDILSMLTKVHQSFTIPNMQLYQSTQDCLSPVEPTFEYMSSFINFLLEILSCAEYKHIKKLGDSDEEHIIRYVVLLRQELTLLFTILGDIFFQFTNHDILLPQFETIAIEIGSLIYDCLFEKLTSTMFNERRDAILKNFSLLKSFIEKHCHEFSDLRPRYVAPRLTIPIDAPFIVHSLIQDLENFNTIHFDCTVDDVVNQINILQSEINFSVSLLKEIYKLPQHRDKNELLAESLIKIRDVAHEAEYLINSHVAEQYHVWYLNLRLPFVIHKIKITNKTLQDMGGKEDINNVSKEVPSQPLLAPAGVVENLVVGFKEHKIRILGDLIKGPKNLNTICIFGMPGLGKTTTSRKLYQDPSVYHHFDRCAWCVVSQEYEKRMVLIEIFTSLGNKLSNDEIMELTDEKIGLKIHQNLFGRRYLIVIDDVWQSNVLDELKRYFPDNANGSRILLTSRNQNVAPVGCILRSLSLLSEVQSWELLRNKVFFNEPCPPELLELGKKIAKNCRGLPLALVTTAGILSNVKKEVISWEHVMKQLDTYLLEDDDSNYRKILELSFEHLPNHLKLCFLYLGVFPEDNEIETGRLIRMWIAERFIPRFDEKEPENVGKEFLDDLISRSLLVIARRGSDGEIKTCTIHDLLRDMCIRRAYDEKFIKYIKRNEVPITGKHKCLISDSESPKWRYLPQCCRTYIGNVSTRSHSGILRIPLLRVMDAKPSQWCFEVPYYFVIPNQLRYLAFGRMPEPKEGYFSKLEFLHVESYHSQTIPSIILKIGKLRYLRVERDGKFEDDCENSRTNSLRYFSQVQIGDKRHMEILKCSPLLHRLKCRLTATRADLDFSFFAKLESLTLDFDLLSISDWSKASFPPTIQKLHLQNARMPWEMMSIVGTLPNLHVLKLGKESYIGEEWNTTEGEFLQLRFLKLEKLDFKSWNTDDSGHFPKLGHLVLSHCKNLQKIPSDFSSHTTLQKIEVISCNKYLEESAASIEEEQHEYSNEAFQVIIVDKS